MTALGTVAPRSGRTRPDMTASAPATYMWNVVNTDTGLPGKQMIGVSRLCAPTGVDPTPCGPPGCWAT